MGIIKNSAVIFFCQQKMLIDIRIPVRKEQTTVEFTESSDQNFKRPVDFTYQEACMAAILFSIFYNRVMRVGSDTFGDPIFQKGLQN